MNPASANRDKCRDMVGAENLKKSAKKQEQISSKPRSSMKARNLVRSDKALSFFRVGLKLIFSLPHLAN
jgi:hypothetical protein